MLKTVNFRDNRGGIAVFSTVRSEQLYRTASGKVAINATIAADKTVTLHLRHHMVGYHNDSVVMIRVLELLR